MTRNFVQICRFNNDVYLGTDTQTLQQRLEALEYGVQYNFLPETTSTIINAEVTEAPNGETHRKVTVHITTEGRYVGPKITWSTTRFLASPASEVGTLENGQAWDLTYSWSDDGSLLNNRVLVTLKFNDGDIATNEIKGIMGKTYSYTLNWNKATLSVTQS